ncbi:ANTAR domain-containing protein [Amycolatopsis sp. NPDC005232]|uniref:ANTAR domain-containing response regulator n=1 Tax=Amycolatopsis sp. NPDC005232 TaxID=3157027 RepID=UPI0033AB8006
MQHPESIDVADRLLHSPPRHSRRDGAGNGSHGESDLAERYRAAQTELEQLRQVLSSRAPIEQAKGILMAQRRCTAGEAFEILRELSQDTNVKLRDVARGLIEEVVSTPRRCGPADSNSSQPDDRLPSAAS